MLHRSARRMVCKVCILSIILAGALGLSKAATDESAFYRLSSTQRIIGGTPADSVPYMVALSYGLMVRSFFCGGSLISTRTILTAAHCVNAVFYDGSLSSTIRATVGTNRWNVAGVNYRIAKNITHPNYVVDIIKNDISLLITATRVKLSDSIRTVPLQYSFLGSDVEAKVTGWGLSELPAALPLSLQQLTVNTVNGERCVIEVAAKASEIGITHPPVQPHIEMCTFHSQNHGMCFGDSGSPLVRVGQQRQIGIVSWGLPCALGAPDVFVRISAYKDWLQRNIRN